MARRPPITWSITRHADNRLELRVHDTLSEKQTLELADHLREWVTTARGWNYPEKKKKTARIKEAR